MRTPRARWIVAAVAAGALAVATVGAAVMLRRGTDPADAQVREQGQAAAPETPVLMANGAPLRDGAELRQPVRLQVSGRGVTRVKWVVDGVYVADDTSAPFSLIPDLAAGERRVKADAVVGSAEHRLNARFTVLGSATSTPDVAAGTRSGQPAGTPGGDGAATGRRQVAVSTVPALRAALMSAKPGDVITLAPGEYAAGDACTVPGGFAPAHFCTNRPGTAEAPIVLRGEGAVLKGDGVRSRYGLYLWQAPHWHIFGLTVRDASKGIVIDRSPRVVLDSVTVTSIGEEGVHFRSGSADGVIRNSEVSDTGLVKPRFGEGVYVGSAHSNWGKHSNGQPDRSDRVQVVGNRILRTRGECIDIKEGTTGVVVRGNTFDGSKIAGENSADSWVDAKGNDALIEGNTGKSTPRDGFQSHTVYDGWGLRNVFRRNVAYVNGPGYGFWMQSDTNVVACGQRVVGAGSGVSNTRCTS